MAESRRMRLARPCPICGATGEHEPKCPIAEAAKEHSEISAARVRRDRLILKARKRGASQQQIADGLGVSKRLVQLMEKDAAG